MYLAFGSARGGERERERESECRIYDMKRAATSNLEIWRSARVSMQRSGPEQAASTNDRNPASPYIDLIYQNHRTTGSIVHIYVHTMMQDFYHPQYHRLFEV